VRDAGSRPVMLKLRKPAIDVLVECKAFPRKQWNTTTQRNFFEQVSVAELEKSRDEARNIRRWPEEDEG
jgi:hypothetical protein